MEISDLVNTIEGLTEELAIDIVARAEILAEEQAEDLPRRKGGRPVVAAAESGAEPAPVESEDAQGNAGKPTLDELFGGEDDGGGESLLEQTESEGAPDEASDATRGGRDEDGEATDPDPEDGDFRDLALAEETSGHGELGHEVTSRPSNDDQDETSRIVTEA